MGMFNRVLAALLCAEADLQGILPDYDPDGTHPAHKTLRDLKKAIHIMEDAGFELVSLFSDVSDYEEQEYWDDENQLVEETK